MHFFKVIRVNFVNHFLTFRTTQYFQSSSLIYKNQEYIRKQKHLGKFYFYHSLRRNLFIFFHKFYKNKCLFPLITSLYLNVKLVAKNILNNDLFRMAFHKKLPDFAIFY